MPQLYNVSRIYNSIMPHQVQFIKITYYPIPIICYFLEVSSKSLKYIYSIENGVPTLFVFDATLMNQSLDASFLAQINREKVVIYEKP